MSVRSQHSFLVRPTLYKFILLFTVLFVYVSSRSRVYYASAPRHSKHCQKFVKFSLTLMIIGTQMAKMTKLCGRIQLPLHLICVCLSVCLSVRTSMRPRPQTCNMLVEKTHPIAHAATVQIYDKNLTFRTKVRDSI